MSENSTIVKNSLVLYIRLIFVSVIGLVSSRFILQALGVSDFGLYNVVGGVVTMMSFLNIVMISTTYRFIAFEIVRGKLEDVNKVFNISLIIHLVLALLVVIFALTFGVYYIKFFLKVDNGKLDDAFFVFFFSVLGVVLSIITIPYQGLLTAKEKFTITAPIEIIKSLISLVAIILIMNYSGNRLRLYAVLVSVVTSIPPVLYYLYCRYNFSSITNWKVQKDKSKYKEMMGFSGWIMIGAGASVGETQGSALIINSFFGTILNSGFGIASQVNSFVKMFSQSLSQAVIPQITKSYSSGRTDRTAQLVIYASKYSFFLMLIPSLPLLLETNFILNLWLTVVPIFTKIFIQIMLVNALITTMSAGVPAAIQATGKIKYFQIVLSSIMLLGLPAAYIAFTFGLPPYSILIVYTCTSIIIFIVQLVMLKIILNFNIEFFIKKAFFKMMLVSIFVSPLFIIRDFFDAGLLRFLCMGTLSIVWLLAAVYIIGIERNETALISSFFKKIKETYFKKKLK